MTLLFVGASQVVTCAGPARARRGREMADAGVVRGAAVAVVDDRIVAVGPQPELERRYPDASPIDCHGGVLTPGLVDSHTHAIFGRPRFDEQERRALGADYLAIAAAGGGIHASVRDLRERSEDDLLALTEARISRLASYGTTTVEVKSGYGLSVDDELKMLRVAARAASAVPVRIVPTWLGAHEIPIEFRSDRDGRRAYMDLVLNDMLPRVARSGLQRSPTCSASQGCSRWRVARDPRGGPSAGLGVKMHADELAGGGARSWRRKWARRQPITRRRSPAPALRRWPNRPPIATLLPGTMLFLGKSAHGPARALLEAGAAVALATDFNPGTSPTVNFPLILTLGVSQLGLSVAEALIAATVNGAAALGLAGKIGQTRTGLFGRSRPFRHWGRPRAAVLVW